MMDGKHKGEPEPRRVRVFFYGTFMSPEVLARYGINVENVRFITTTRVRVDAIFFHNFTAAGSRKAQTKQEERAVILDFRNDSWDVIEVRRR